MTTAKSIDALILVPPYINVTTGPLLGPAMLAGAARAAGFDVAVLDLAERWVRDTIWPGVLAGDPRFVGDHDRDEAQVAAAKTAFVRRIDEATLGLPAVGVGTPALTLPWTHEPIDVIVERLLGGSFGRWLAACLAGAPRPRTLAVSVLYSGQVLAGLAASRLARAIWPGVRVVWGGAHVTALAPEIAFDARYGRHVDGFVSGYAERTFVQMLAAQRAGDAPPPAVFRAGSGLALRATDDVGVVPVFDWGATERATAVTLPTQASRGCAYGKCTFCTYPVIEGAVRDVPTDVVSAVLREAAERGARVSFKDAFLHPTRMRALIRHVPDGVGWSACTRLGHDLVLAVPLLAACGLRTLEIGLETLDPTAARSILKRHDERTLRSLMRRAADHDVSLVLNYITDIPFADNRAEATALERLHEMVDAERGLVAKIERNGFQLERRAPLARDPRIEVTASWPWASVQAWRERAGRVMRVVA